MALIPVAVLGVIAALVCSGALRLNRPSMEAYPVRGVDVSHYQGSIDWNALQAQGIMFACIKATEGSSHTDSAFRANWENIARTELRAGAYHFFSFESSGLDQAGNYTKTVSASRRMLPPAIDIEPYGRFRTIGDIPGAVSEIKAWLRAVEAEYGARPVIYTTEAFYRDCIGLEFPDYDIWIRSVWKRPSGSVRWRFWQYSSRSRLKGYDGTERFIDMNVFNGTPEEFWEYGG